MNKQTRVVVAMSGGVDSSVAAALLVDQGFDVIGMMLRLWSEPGLEDFNRCCAPEAMRLAREVASILNIPFYVVDVRQEFFDNVVQYFIDSYMNGITPNPCLKCNRVIRWKFMRKKALALGARYLATGHYARVNPINDNFFQLLRGIDRNKDQSYVLHSLSQEQLSHTLLPIGGYTKLQVRNFAREFHLPVAGRSDSQDLCFIGNNDYRNFLLRYVPKANNPGKIINCEGEEVGKHRGLAFYTIGQRKGLGISAPTPYYVKGIDSVNNVLIVGRKDQLGRIELEVDKMNWILEDIPHLSFKARVKIRYKATDANATIYPLKKTQIRVTFDTPLVDITPGQAAVLYDHEVCLGGGIIQKQKEK